MLGRKRVRDDALTILNDAGLLEDGCAFTTNFLPCESGGLDLYWHELPGWWVPCYRYHEDIQMKGGEMWFSVHERDGIQWRLCKGVYTLNGSRFHHPLLDVRRTGNLCAATILQPLDFERFFRRTFRYWLIVAVVRDKWLPYPEPMDSNDVRYDIMHDHTMNLHGAPGKDEAKVRARLETGNLTPEQVEETWTMYRRAWAKVACWPTFWSVLFVARVRVRVRKAFEPGGREYLRIKQAWEDRL